MSENLDIDEVEHLKFLKNRFVIINRIGEGTFSRVYKAMDIKNNRYYALKAITKTSSPNRIIDELAFLVKLKGLNNCVPLNGVLRHEDQVVGIFPYFEYTDFRDILTTATIYDIKKYMYNLLIAIEHVHSCNIIHRDIKPGNFLYNRDTETGWLIDFGLAQYETKHDTKKKMENEKSKTKPQIFFNTVVSKSKPPGYYERDTRPTIKAPRAGTRGFRAPEVVFKYPYQTNAIDIWSAGVIFLNLLTGQYPFFYSGEDIDALVEMGTIFGHKEMRKAAKQYNRVWKSNIDTIPEDRVPFEKIVDSLGVFNIPESDAHDLLYRMLDLNVETRITAEEALEHSFFDSIKS
ncbi:CDC7-like protein kinase [Vairimorpha necatrix]|uniref:non-specific serine/threonine protein kinase n=1 Tax=Vairimorpha necatrix TaxID=6039 RepID=A0AAX4JE64_9MICR